MNQPVIPGMPVAAEPQPFSLTLEKFTKEKVYNLLLGIAEGQSTIAFNSEESLNQFKHMVNINFKPQAGGGKSNNPSHIDPATGLMVHWCRFLKRYMPETDMVMSGGKSKGASKLAAKHNYELKKQAQKLKDEALVLFGDQKYAEGAVKNEEAKAIELSADKVESYSDEILVQYLPKPKEAPVAEVAAPIMPQSIEQGVPVVPQMQPQAPMMPPAVDVNGNPIYAQ